MYTNRAYENITINNKHYNKNTMSYKSFMSSFALQFSLLEVSRYFKHWITRIHEDWKWVDAVQLQL